VTVTGIARFLASIAFGAIWTFGSARLAIVVFAVALIGALALAVVLLRVQVRRAVHA
jgi:hypothetical protein